MTTYIVKFGHKLGAQVETLFAAQANVAAEIQAKRTGEPAQVIRRRPGEADQTNTYYPDGSVEREWEEESV